MKNVILIFAFILATFSLSAKKYKPLSAFKKDTTAFIIYNFMENANYYSGKTLKEVVNDLQIPVQDFAYSWNPGKGNKMEGIHIYIYSESKVNKLRDQGMDHNIILIKWENDAGEVSDIRRKLGIQWNQQVYDYFQDFKIKSVQVIIPFGSKYYMKYNKPKPKSSQLPFNVVKDEGVFTPIPDSLIWPSYLNELPYKSLSDFQNNTKEFLNYNFFSRSRQYRGKNIQDIVPDIEMPIKCVAVKKVEGENNICGLYLGIYDKEELLAMQNRNFRNAARGLIIEWEEKIAYNKKINKLLKSNDMNEIIDYFKHLSIKNVSLYRPTPKNKVPWFSVEY